MAVYNLPERSEQHPFAEYSLRTLGDPQGSTNCLLRIPDFFTERALDRAGLRGAFPFLADALVLQDQPETYSVLVPYGDDEHSHVKVSFFGRIGFGRVGEPQWTEDANLLVASLDDLMATKVKVVLQRVEAKDYRDVAAMSAAGVSLAKGLSSARQLYGSAFQPSEALKALVYFDGGDLDSLSPAERQTLIAAVAGVRDLPEVSLGSEMLGNEQRSVANRSTERPSKPRR